MHIAELWRFPVKSMRGERLDSAQVTENGLDGDRVVHVQGGRGVLTARTRHRLLTLSATTGPLGEPLIDGRPWDDPLSLAAVRAAAGEDARPVRYLGAERFDVLPLLVATDGAIAEFGHDGRRLRPNIVVGGVPGLAERSWSGQALRVGEVTIGVRSPRPRCVVTTIDPDSGVLDAAVLRRIHREFGGALALDCWVLTPGRIQLGDPVEVVDLAVPAPPSGGWITGAAYQVV